MILAPLFASVAGAAAVAPNALRPPQPPAAVTVKSTPLAAAAVQAAPAVSASSSINHAVAQWNSLRQSDTLPFSHYAAFLTRYRGWPGESALRRTAERAIDPAVTPPAEVIRYFRVLPPVSATGHARYAFALLASGQAGDARDAAREAWRSSGIARPDEDRLLAQFGGSLRPEDHDRRIEALLSSGDTASALRVLGLGSPSRRQIYETRIALQTRASDASARLTALGSGGDGDPGLIMDRAKWLRDTAQNMSARAVLARPRTLSSHPADPEKWYETLLDFARGAAADKQWSLAYQIASQVDDAYPAGTDVTLQPYGERDDYTSLTWLAGTVALHELNRPADAEAMFLRYSKGGRSAQVTTKGLYWAGRAALAAGRPADANRHFAEAAAFPELFYAQLSLERLGRAVPPPPTTTARAAPSAAERAAYLRRDLVEATRLLGYMGRWDDQALFVRTLSEQAESEQERALAAELADQINRPDLAVWVARSARNAGTPFYVRAAYPEVSIPPAQGRHWSLAHGIIRQESSFDRTAVSHAGARGMMQLMPPTARQVAGKLSVGYELGRLTRDPDYNVLLGCHYFAGLMDTWGNHAPLALASYNAGTGNVRRWIAANGDPRMPGVDIVKWIEDIPFAETRGYVQRVLENTVVYDSIHPARARSNDSIRLSYYLGKTGRPG